MFVNRKQLLCKIARTEGGLGFREFSHKADSQIEKYLAVFRLPIYEISHQAHFLDLTQGYNWCCAFVYWCCQQAGYQIPIRASMDSHYTLAAVGNWVEYADITACGHVYRFLKAHFHILFWNMEFQS